MSLPLDLDEYTDKQLEMELNRRSEARFNGKCDYCGRSPETIPCRFVLRHRMAKKKEVPGVKETNE